MPDFADTASELQDLHLARSLAAARAPVPAGAPGECDNCGDAFPRLVGGLCGFCRDGRRPRFDRVPALVPINDHDEEENTMPNGSDTKSFTLAARGAARAAIEERVAAGLSVSEAMRELIEAGLRVDDAPAVPPASEPAAIPPALAALSVGELLDELGRRLDGAASPAELDQALARAGAAEAQLARVRAALGGEA